ncbi:VanZ family protein [Thioalkalivibrio sp. XN279]|uniref:VanZ family protein n=1 Tax=Thioalkalivibrio sp. XN279 TaxID=2714953 RepID=UPI00140D3DB0|nr:VanZ family protein [Thioalkalivibrio sp. XN279]NHA14327.1 VanZ family protein [Thioalkalivibrio sp. XN279]
MIARLVMAWRLLAWGMALAILVGSLWPSMPSVAGGISDKLLHFLAYAALALVFAAAFSRRHWLAIALGLAVFGALIEMLQHWLPGRRAGEWMDQASNLGGIAVGLTLALAVPHRWRRKLDRVLGRPEGVA